MDRNGGSVLFFLVAGMGCAALALGTVLPVVLVGIMVYFFGGLFDVRSGGRKRRSRK